MPLAFDLRHEDDASETAFSPHLRPRTLMQVFHSAGFQEALQMASIGPVEHDLASLAHRVWCEDMIAQGWRPGPYDLTRHTHDAIVPFDQLSVVDRRNTTISVRAAELIDQLRETVEYPRGEAREFAASELFVGLRVGFVDDDRLTGSIQDWQEDADWPGCVRTLTVRWDSGEVIEYVACECELRRLDK